jgi:hypothetical protein
MKRLIESIRARWARNEERRRFALLLAAGGSVTGPRRKA